MVTIIQYMHERTVGTKPDVTVGWSWVRRRNVRSLGDNRPYTGPRVGTETGIATEFVISR